MRFLTFFIRFFLLFSLFTLSAWGEESEVYHDGTPFFLLTDTTFSSHENATVRLEANELYDIENYGGVDVYVYKVKDPLAFLKAQKNLHRITVEPNYSGVGLSNALSMAWDKIWLESRTLWRKLFTKAVRAIVTNNVPQVRTHPLEHKETPLMLNPKYQPLKGHTLIDQFRYPLHRAKPIQPPKGVVLAGSSSEFTDIHEGNVLIPLGKKSPGLYLIEAMVGDHRAITLMFVSDSVAITKVASQQMVTWVAKRTTSEGVEGVKTIWSDGVGVLDEANTNAQGLVTFERKTPEKSYCFGEDPAGGVFVSENYYYDSEIYNTKLYATTDRPLYRPGDTVYLKFFGRHFTSDRLSTALQNGEVTLEVYDPSGFPVGIKTLTLGGKMGGASHFRLPTNATSGGYELRFTYRNNTYTAAFRVSEYQKPHFEVAILGDKPNFNTHEKVTGKLQLTYPDGKPVANATIDLSVRAQQLSMIEGDLGYSGMFPLKLSNTILTTDKNGIATFSLPQAEQPSRYILSALATDGATYRVRATKELLIQRGSGTYTLTTQKTFSQPNEKVTFTTHTLTQHPVSTPVSWEWVRLEDQHHAQGTLITKDHFDVVFDRSGSYTLSVYDEAHTIIAATSHWVSGEGVHAPTGSITMISDQSAYAIHEKATVLVTFPEAIEHALFTLERDRVERTALLGEKSAWMEAQKISPTQWKVTLPMEEAYGTNIVLSAVYVKGNSYVFQNCGLKINQPTLTFDVHPDKAVYAPGETVTLDLTAYKGEKLSPHTPIALGVVDEMIYVLQPEVAPNIVDFFYHPRRNNVRTTASLSFIGYDLAKPPSSVAFPKANAQHQRAIKIQERPRRDEIDTAYWNPNLVTDGSGLVRVTFKMPDSLTRWRITVKGMDEEGIVGQTTSYIRCEKPFYLKWTSPNWLRLGDKPNASVALFNQTATETTLQLNAHGAGVNTTQNVHLKTGTNFITLPLSVSPTDKTLTLTLGGEKGVVDSLSVPLKIAPSQWLTPHSVTIPITAQETPLTLPSDATNLTIQFTQNAQEQLHRMMDDLIDYPYGCVEQTSSRLIPYALALQSLRPQEQGLWDLLSQRLHTFRFRLAQMAGPNAVFGWWRTPQKEGDPFLTTYAYYADWYASRALHLKLPKNHFDTLLEVYRHQGIHQTHWKRALMLDWMEHMGLPIRSLSQALITDLTTHPVTTPTNDPQFLTNSMVMTSENGELHEAMAYLLVTHTFQKAGGTLLPAMVSEETLRAQRVERAALPLGDALLLYTGHLPHEKATSILEHVRTQSPTMDRALTLVWVHHALSATPDLLMRTPQTTRLASNAWQAQSKFSGQTLYQYKGLTLPKSFTTTPAAGLVAVVNYESSQTQTSTLPLQIRRHWYRLVKKTPTFSNKGRNTPLTADEALYTLVLVGENEPLHTDELYLDEIVLTPHTSSPLNYGLLHVALPPGCIPESGTWGISVRAPKGKNSTPLEKATYELAPQGYVIPIDNLKGKLTLRNLVRPAQTGTFSVPPIRYGAMYQPALNAFEENPRAILTIR